MSTAALPFVPRYRRWPAVLGSLGALLLVLVVSCEVVGWPFLAEPIQRWLSASLHRRVSFAIDGNTPASVVVRLFGRVRIEAPLITIGPPAWSQSTHMIRASDAVVSFHYIDLWRAHRGEPLRIHMLEADEFDADIERLADGRASWQFGSLPAASDREPHAFRMPLFGELKVHGGTLRWRDAVSNVQMALECRASDQSADAGNALASARPVSSQIDPAAGGLACRARGTWRKEPVSVAMQSVASMPWVNRDPAAERTPMVMDASVGDMHVSLRGSVIDVLGLREMNARFEAEGTTLSTLAKAFDVQLEGRAPFRATGEVTKDSQQWRVTLDRLELGTSELKGQLTLDLARALPMLTGKLEGPRLTWGDIAGAPLPAAADERQSIDVPAFRTLDANVSVDVAQVDFGDAAARQPLRGTWRSVKGLMSWVPAAQK